METNQLARLKKKKKNKSKNIITCMIYLPYLTVQVPINYYINYICVVFIKKNLKELLIGPFK